MGKNLVQQARGKGGPRYRANSFHFKGEAKRYKGSVEVIDILRCRAHSGPLAEVEYEDKSRGYILAVQGIRSGDSFEYGTTAPLKNGMTKPLSDIPIGMDICNIEHRPGDGGKFVRGSGLSAKILSKSDAGIIVVLPSKKKKTFNPNCMATLGIIAGGGRTEKPFLKAGKKFHKMRQKNKLYPITSGHSQNAVDHPMGNKRSARKSKRKPVGRGTPPGRKVGSLYARRTGRKRGKM
jgi:large subunit ribosomal protein L2